MGGSEPKSEKQVYVQLLLLLYLVYVHLLLLYFTVNIKGYERKLI